MLSPIRPTTIFSPAAMSMQSNTPNPKKSLPTIISQRSRILLSRFRRNSPLPAIYVCGLLGTTSITADADKWMATDFVALRHLIGAPEDHSLWLCGTSIHDAGRLLLGDPACDRIEFKPPSFETVDEPPSNIFKRYIVAVQKMTARLSPNDVLVLVLVGHGNQSGSLLIGDDVESYELRKEHLEVILEASQTQAKVILINTACLSGAWESPHWSLIAAAASNQDAPSIVISGSGECRGGFFTNAMIAGHAHDYHLKAPRAPSLDETGNRMPQPDHDFGTNSAAIPHPRVPISLQAFSDWIVQWRNSIGRTYTLADITFIPCPSDKAHSLPFLPLTSPNATLHRLPCVGPSPAEDHASYSAAAVLPPQSPRNSPITSMDDQEEAELVERATDLLRFMPIQSAQETGTILKCWRVVHGVVHGKPLDNAEKPKLLLQLRNRAQQQEAGLRITKNLGWEKAVEQLGGPIGKQEPAYALQNEAEENGCFVKALIIQESPIRQWVSVSGWLARVWEASGRPTVTPDEWALALDQNPLVHR